MNTEFIFEMMEDYPPSLAATNKFKKQEKDTKQTVYITSEEICNVDGDKIKKKDKTKLLSHDEMLYKYTKDEWNSQADEFNQWDSLSEEEKVAFTYMLSYHDLSNGLP